MDDFFSQQLGNSIEWFSLQHLLLILGFLLSMLIIWVLAPTFKHRPSEKIIRYILVGLAVIFEWFVFEDRMLNQSIFRIPLCGIALYGLTYAIAFKNEKVYRITYYYAFGALLTYVFYDTLWGLDRWNGWSFFGAHAAIGWFAVYGYRVLDYRPTQRDLFLSMALLSVYALISGYGTYKYGGSDPLFLLNPPVDFVYFLKEIHQALYVSTLIVVVIILMLLMYLPFYISEKRSNIHSINIAES